MNIYRIYQDDNNGYDTFDSAVVICEDAEMACSIHPGIKDDMNDAPLPWNETDHRNLSSWTRISNVHSELIGVAPNATNRRIVCASFNAG